MELQVISTQCSKYLNISFIKGCFVERNLRFQESNKTYAANTHSANSEGQFRLRKQAKQWLSNNQIKFTHLFARYH